MPVDTSKGAATVRSHPGQALRSWGPRRLGAAAAIAVAAVGLRIWSVTLLLKDLRITDPILDGRFYLDMALRLAHGQTAPAEPYFMTPLYPSLLSLFFTWGTPTVQTILVGQSVLGLATLVLLAAAARRDLGASAAWGTAILYTLCGPILAMESQVLVESTLLLLAAAALWYWPAPEKRLYRLPLFGLICGGLTSGRGVFALLPLAAMGYLALRLRFRVKLWLRNSLLIAAGVAIALAPMFIHQWRTTGAPHVLTLNGGLNLYIGNNELSRGIYSQPPELDIERDFTGVKAASKAMGMKLTMEQSSHYWAGRALDFMHRHPSRALWLFGRKALLYLSPTEIPQLEVFSALRRSTPPLAVAFLDFAWILPLAALGTGWWLRARRGIVPSASPGGNRRGPVRIADRAIPEVIPWITLIAVGWISTIVFFATARYRIPFLAGFLGLAALGITALLEMVRSRRASLLLVVLPLAFGFERILPRYDMKRAEAHDIYTIGRRLDDRGEYQAALARYQEALQLSPREVAAWYGIGYCNLQLGHAAEAATAFENAARSMPYSPATYNDLAAAYLQLGRKDDAVRALQQALRLDPENQLLRNNLARILAQKGK